MEFGCVSSSFHRQVPGQSDAGMRSPRGSSRSRRRTNWGLDVFWLAEIHQQARRSVLSAPMNVAGQIAARTKRIKVGTAVHVLPLTHPLRLAEETSTVDVVSRGRFILGAGRSGNPRGYSLRHPLFGEPRSVLRDARDSQESMDRADLFLRRQVPQLQRGARGAAALPTAASTDPHRRRQRRHLPDLGHLGYPLFVSVRSGSLVGLKPDLKAYRERLGRIRATRASPRSIFAACRCIAARPRPRRAPKASRASWPGTNR